MEDAKNFKALLISDLHIGQNFSRRESTAEVVQHLRELCEREHPSVVFILGDVIHIRLFNKKKYWTRFYEQMETLGVEVHIIPGNHEKWYYWYISYDGPRVHSHHSELIIVTHKKLRAALGHDVKNDRKVHSTAEVREWYQALRDTFPEVIHSDTLLILGHLHQATDSKDHKTRSIRPFSHDLNCWDYAVLEISDDEFCFGRRKM